MADTRPLRWLIGKELERHRKAAGLTLEAAASKTGIGKAKINHLEIGRQAQAPDDIETLLTAYSVPAHHIDRLTTLTARADEAMWWAPWQHVVPDWLQTYVGLEALAKDVFWFEPFVIPGLLQTQDYAAAVTASTRSIRPDHGDRFVSFRMARARRLTDEQPLHLHAVIPEGALRLDVGNPDVRHDQLEHLVRMSELPNVEVQVIRPEDGTHAGLAGGFVRLDFGEAARPVIYLEQKDGAVYLQDDLQVEAYTMVASDLQRVAMSPQQSHALIASMAEQ